MPGVLGLLVELQRAVQIAVVGQRQGVHAQRLGPLDQALDRRGAVQQAVVAVAMQMNKRRRAHRNPLAECGKFLSRNRYQRSILPLQKSRTKGAVSARKIAHGRFRHRECQSLRANCAATERSANLGDIQCGQEKQTPGKSSRCDFSSRRSEPPATSIQCWARPSNSRAVATKSRLSPTATSRKPSGDTTSNTSSWERNRSFSTRRPTPTCGIRCAASAMSSTR